MLRSCSWRRRWRLDHLLALDAGPRQAVVQSQNGEFAANGLINVKLQPQRTPVSGLADEARAVGCKPMLDRVAFVLKALGLTAL
jgi:hypothetical protein